MLGYNLFINTLLYGIFNLSNLIMKWITKRIRLDPEIDNLMSKLKLRKQDFIRTAISEKLQHDFKVKVKTPF